MQTALEGDTLEQHRLRAVVTMCYKIVNNLVAVPSTQLKPNTRGTRGKLKESPPNICPQVLDNIYTPLNFHSVEYITTLGEFII